MAHGLLLLIVSRRCSVVFYSISVLSMQSICLRHIQFSVSRDRDSRFFFRFVGIKLHIAIYTYVVAYYGILFRGQEEAAFSNFRLFESCGSVITYTLSPMLCASTKIEAVFALMIVGIVG